MTSERWYSLSIEEAEKKLNTNISTGLDIKEAEKRRRRAGTGSIYKNPYMSPLRHATRIASDITVILFLLTAVVSAFFGGGRQAFTAAVLAAAAFVFTIVIHILSKRRFEYMAEYSMPSARVLRGGRVYSIDCRDVVTGDIILLEKGDVLPCDVRLVQSEDLRTVEFVGKIGGKEKKQITEKDASVCLKPEDKPNAASQKNMIVASAVVVSGRGRAMAVRTGSKTFLSLMLGEVEFYPPEKKDMKVLSDISRLLSKISVAFFAAAVPFSILAMLVGKENLQILDVLLVFFALAVTLGSEIISGLLYMLPANAMKSGEKGNNRVTVKYPDAVEELNYVDSVMLFGDKSISYRNKNVESVFAANRFYSGDGKGSEDNTARNCLIDLALLGTSHYLGTGIGVSHDPYDVEILNAKAISEFAELCGIDRETLAENYQAVDFSGVGASAFDTALVKNGEEYRVICTSSSDSLLGICTHIRTPEGAVYFDPEKKAEIISACSQFVKKAKSVTLVASRISPCSSLSRLGAVQNQLIFEGYIVYDDRYVGGLTERISELKDADISVYYIDGETASSVITAFNIGVVKSKNEIAYASAFSRSKKDILDGFGQYKAYLGFTQGEIEKLTRYIKGDNGTLAVVAAETEHLIYMKHANISATLGVYASKRDALSSSLAHSEVLKKNADVLMPVPGRDGGGFSSFCEAVLLSKNTCAGICKFLKYMAFSGAMRIVLALLPLFVGRILLSPVQLIILGAFIDIGSLICFAAGKNIAGFGDKIADIETTVASPVRTFAKYLISGASLGAVILMLAAVFGSYGIAGADTLSVFVFVSTVLIQLVTLLLVADFSRDGIGIKALLLQITAVVIFLLAAIFIPSVGTLFGLSFPGWLLLASAPPVAVIGFVIVLVTDRYI